MRAKTWFRMIWRGLGLLALLAVGGLGIFLRRKRRLLAALGGFVLAIVVLSHPVLAGPYPQTREYMLGDIDDFNYEGPGSEDHVYVDPDFLVASGPAAAGYANGIEDFDVLHANHLMAFTFLFDLAPAEEVQSASLSVALRATDSLVINDRIDLEPGRGLFTGTVFRYDFADLGWLPIPTEGTALRTIDLGNALGCYDHPAVPDDLLPLLGDGMFNIWLHDDIAIDYAILTIEVMPEPATLALLAVGAAALLMRRRH